MAPRLSVVASSPTTMSRTSSTRTTTTSRYTNTSPLGYESSSSVACEGYLRIKKRSALTWSTRFVILRGGDLYVFYSKQDATHRRNLVDALELASGKIAPRTELALELLTRDKREFQARVFSRGDLARWVTAFHRLAIKNETAAAAAAGTTNKRVRYNSVATENQQEPEAQQPQTSNAKSPVHNTEEQECNPVIQNGEARRPSNRRRVAFHGSVMVRMIPPVPQEQVAELFYTKAEVERFTAQAASIFSRTEDAVSCACLTLRRPALPWRSRQQAAV